MAFSRALLWVNVVLFGLYGLGYMLVPDVLARLLYGADFPSAAAAIDARAVFGGMALGLAAFIWLALRGNIASQRVGHVGCAVTYACVALGRFIGIITTKSPSTLTWTLLIGEAAFALLSLYALASLKSSTPSPRGPEAE